MSEVYRGRVEGGVVVFSGAGSPQEGAEVLVVRMDDAAGPPDPTQGETAGLALAQLGRWAETLPTDLPPDLARQHCHSSGDHMSN
jgi:hypothetical protein